MNAVMSGVFHHYGVRFAYLFGSHVHGDQREDSDIDIAVMLPSSLSESERLERRSMLITELARVFKKNVDLVVLSDIRSLFFKYIIIKEGRPIYSVAEGERAEFECRLMGEYFDFASFLETYNRAYVERNL